MTQSPGFHEAGRPEAHAYACRGAGRYNVAGFQGHAAGQVFNNLRKVREEKTGVGVLPFFVVYIASDVCLHREGQGGFVKDYRPHGDLVWVSRLFPLNHWPCWFWSLREEMSLKTE